MNSLTKVALTSLIAGIAATFMSLLIVSYSSTVSCVAPTNSPLKIGLFKPQENRGWPLKFMYTENCNFNPSSLQPVHSHKEGLQIGPLVVDILFWTGIAYILFEISRRARKKYA